MATQIHSATRAVFYAETISESTLYSETKTRRMVFRHSCHRQAPGATPGRHQNKCPRRVEPPHARLPTTYDTTTPLRVRQVRLTAPTTPHHTVAPDCTHVRRPQGGTVAHPWRELDATRRWFEPQASSHHIRAPARPPEGL